MIRGTCPDCSKPLGKGNRVGRCRVCFARSRAGDPAFRRACSEGMKRRAADPAERARMIATVAANRAQRDMAKLRRLGREHYDAVLNRPEVRDRNRAAVRAAAVERFLGWCPAEWRDEYRRVKRRKRLSAPDARALIEQKIAEAAEARRIEAARPKTFAEKLAMVERGELRIVRKPVMPTRSLAFTLGGVSESLAA